MLPLLFYVRLVLLSRISAEVITLISDKNITCILSGESVYSGLYIWPPLAYDNGSFIKIQRPVQQISEWVNSDWRQDFGIDVFPITDLRWEDFTWSSNDSFGDYQSEVQFSVCDNSYLLIDGDKSIYHRLRRNSTFSASGRPKNCNWLHFTLTDTKILQLLDGFVEIISKNASRKILLSISEHNVIRNRTNSFMIAETPSQNPSYLDISNVSNRSNVCISMFVAIDEDCYLDIATDSGNSIFKETIDGFNDPSKRDWKRFEFTIPSYNGSGRMYFSRRKKLQNSCTWIIDFVHLCKPPIDFFQVLLPSQKSENYVCKTLETNSEEIFCNRSGYLGSKCDLKCSDVLGECCYFDKICSASGICKNVSKNGELQLEMITEDGTQSASTSLWLLLLNIPVLILIVLFFLFLDRIKKKRFSERTNPELELTDEEAIMLVENENTTEIPLVDFEKYLQEKLLTNFLALQFNSINVEKGACCVGKLKKNFNKNKDQNNLPYDATRVVLKNLPGVGCDDYINASYVDGYDKEKAYIACQGPKFFTICDFWRMIWQEEAELVIMATDFMENDKRMCAEYWTPKLNSIFEVGELTVKLTSEKIYENYDSRVFEVQYTHYCRKIYHYQLKWKSQTFLYPNDFVPIIKCLRKASSSTTPVVIHSSLGGNRTGILILCDLALQMAKIENKIDFYKLVKKMKMQRPNILNEAEYYILAHLVVLECLLDEENPFSGSLKDNFKISRIEQQRSFLERAYWRDEIITPWQPENNIYSNSLRSITVDGYKEGKKFLIVKQPKDSVKEFWTVVANEQIKFIVSLNKLKHKIFPYADSDGKSRVKITQLQTFPYNSYSLIQLLLLIYDSATKDIIVETEVWFVQLHGWRSKQYPKTPTNILSMIGYLITNSKDRRISVTCQDGIYGSTLMVALLYLIQKYEAELEIDVCTALRKFKQGNNKLVIKPNHLKFLYTSLSEYFENFDKYQHVGDYGKE